MDFAKKSPRVSQDKVAMKQIKNYLNMREKITQTQPGRRVHGRELKQPKSIPKLKTKDSSLTIGGFSDAKLFNETTLVHRPKIPSLNQLDLANINSRNV